MSQAMRDWIEATAAAMAEPVIQTVGTFDDYPEEALQAAVKEKLRELLRDLRPADDLPGAA